VRVLFCSNELVRTGAPLILAEYVPAMGFDATVYCRTDGPLRETFEVNGCRVTDRLDVRGFDVVVANTLVCHEAVGRAVAAGVPVVWMIHESDPRYFSVPGRVEGLLRAASRVVFPCRPTASVYARFCRDRSEVVPLVIAPPPLRERAKARRMFDIGPDEFVALSVGKVEARKGQSDLVEAAAGLPVRVFLVGDVAHRREVAAAGANVTLTGGVADPSWHYAAADVYVCCSRIEAFPRSVMEAAANRLPIITTPCYGVREMVRDGVHGLYYRPGRTADLRGLLEAVRTDPYLRDRIITPLGHLPTFAQAAGRLAEVVRAAGRR
jgi:glycosyltransferase involved in cell wall biosynthesis